MSRQIEEFIQDFLYSWIEYDCRQKYSHQTLSFSIKEVISYIEHNSLQEKFIDAKQDSNKGVYLIKNNDKDYQVYSNERGGILALKKFQSLIEAIKYKLELDLGSIGTRFHSS